MDSANSKLEGSNHDSPAREKLIELLRVVLLQRDAGEDHRAGVDIRGQQTRIAVPARDRRFERRGVDRVACGVRRQDDGGAVHDLALDDDVAARERVGEPLEPEAGEHRVARRRADVDADGPQDDVVGLAFFELARERRGIDRLVVVRVRVAQAICFGKTASMREGMPRFRSSSS